MGLDEGPKAHYSAFIACLCLLSYVPRRYGNTGKLPLGNKVATLEVEYQPKGRGTDLVGSPRQHDTAYLRVESYFASSELHYTTGSSSSVATDKLWVFI